MKHIYLVILVFFISQNNETFCVYDYSDLFGETERSVYGVTDYPDCIYGELFTEANTPKSKKKTTTLKPTPRSAPTPAAVSTPKPASASIPRPSRRGRYDFLYDRSWDSEVNIIFFETH